MNIDQYARDCHKLITVEKQVPVDCQSDLERMSTRVVELLAHVAELEAGPAPGDVICEVLCPCCGASLDVHHGPDEGEIAIVGTSGKQSCKELAGSLDENSHPRWAYQGPYEEPCPHPARNGFHEVYINQKGKEFCRACGRISEKTK